MEFAQEKVDVVIVGGGLVGTASAYYMARAGLKVCLLEKGDIAGEQSGRAWGFVRQQCRDPKELPLMIESNRIWQGLEEELGADLDWRQAGNMGLAEDAAAMAGYEGWVAVARDHDLDTRLLTAQEVADLYPGMKHRWAGGLFTASDGKADPSKTTWAFAQAARSLGADLRCDAAVLAIECGGGKVLGVKTERGSISCPRVLCAAGAWTSQLLAPLGRGFPQQRIRASVGRTTPITMPLPIATWAESLAFRQRPDGSVNLAAGDVADVDVTLTSLSDVKAFWPSFKDNHQYFNLRFGASLGRDLMARLGLGAGARSDPLRRQVIGQPAVNRTNTARALREFKRLFPGHETTELIEEWACYIDVTPDMLPVLGSVQGLDGLLVASGLSGHGFAMGPIVGRLMAEIMERGEASLDLEPLRHSRFAEGDFGPAYVIV